MTHEPRPTRYIPRLTPSEHLLLKELSYGYDNNTIATHLHCSHRAVKTALSTIYIKLDTPRGRPQAIRAGFYHGFLTTSDKDPHEQ